MGFLRSATSLIQTIGRAARHVDGEAILYAHEGRCSRAMADAIAETTRRREAQLAHNAREGIVPRPLREEGGAAQPADVERRVLLAFAAQIAMPQLGRLFNYDYTARYFLCHLPAAALLTTPAITPVPVSDAVFQQRLDALRGTPIERLELPVRMRRFIRKVGIRTLGDLWDAPRERMDAKSAWPGVSRKVTSAGPPSPAAAADALVAAFEPRFAGAAGDDDRLDFEVFGRHGAEHLDHRPAGAAGVDHEFDFRGDVGRALAL
jgi:hypothetical protein